MKSDNQGCSTVAEGQEKYEHYTCPITKKKLVQYDYRHNGKLFTTTAISLAYARSLRDAWLRNMGMGK